MSSINPISSDGSQSPFYLTTSSSSYPATPSEEVQKQYNELLDEINAILQKSNPTDADVAALKNAITALDKLKKEDPPVLTEQMKTFADIMIALIPVSSSGEFKVSLETIKALSDFELKLNGKTMSLTEALKAMTADPGTDVAYNQSLSDMLLEFSTQTYEMYMQQLTILNEQLVIAQKILVDLGVIQDILSKTEITYPNGGKFPPTQASDIPEDLLAKIPEPDRSTDPVGWVKKNTQTYIDWMDVKYGEEIDIKPGSGSTSASTINDLLAARDDLKKQLAELEKNPNLDKSTGSVWETTTKAIAGLEKYFPTTTYPEGAQIKTITTKTEVMEPIYEERPMKDSKGHYVYNKDGTIKTETVKTGEKSYTPPQYTTEKTTQFVDKDGKPLEKPTVSQAKSDIKKFIVEQQGGGSDMNNYLTKAIQASMSLNTQTSDEIKLQNSNMQTMYDILISLMKDLQSQMMGFARNINK